MAQVPPKQGEQSGAAQRDERLSAGTPHLSGRETSSFFDMPEQNFVIGEEIAPYFRPTTVDMLGGLASRAITSAIKIDPSDMVGMNAYEQAEYMDEVAKEFAKFAPIMLNPNMLIQMLGMFGKTTSREEVESRLAEMGLANRDWHMIKKELDKTQTSRADQGYSPFGLRLVTPEGIPVSSKPRNDRFQITVNEKSDEVPGYAEIARMFGKRLARDLDPKHLAPTMQGFSEFMKGPSGKAIFAAAMLTLQFATDYYVGQELINLTRDLTFPQGIRYAAMTLDFLQVPLLYMLTSHDWKMSEFRNHFKNGYWKDNLANGIGWGMFAVMWTATTMKTGLFAHQVFNTAETVLLSTPLTGDALFIQSTLNIIASLLIALGISAYGDMAVNNAAKAALGASAKENPQTQIQTEPKQEKHKNDLKDFHAKTHLPESVEDIFELPEKSPLLENLEKYVAHNILSLEPEVIELVTEILSDENMEWLIPKIIGRISAASAEEQPDIFYRVFKDLLASEEDQTEA